MVLLKAGAFLWPPGWTAEEVLLAWSCLESRAAGSVGIFNQPHAAPLRPATSDVHVEGAFGRLASPSHLPTPLPSSPHPALLTDVTSRHLEEARVTFPPQLVDSLLPPTSSDSLLLLFLHPPPFHLLTLHIHLTLSHQPTSCPPPTTYLTSSAPLTCSCPSSSFPKEKLKPPA